MILAPACGAARREKKHILCLLSHCGGGGFPRVRSQWRQPMPTNPAFLLACATVATLGLSAASSTPADARPCREGSCSVRSAIAGAMQAAMAKQMQAAMAKQAGAMKAAMAKKMQAAMVAKQAEMEKQMQAAMMANQAEMEKKAKAEMAAKQAEMEKQASNAAAGVSMVPTENPMAPPPMPSLSEGKGKGQEPSAAPVAATPCLTKEYLNGNAILRNNCTGEWVAAPEPIPPPGGLSPLAKR